MLAVTTFSPQGYEDYGRACLESLDQHWPGKIVAYIEEMPAGVAQRIELRQFYEIDNVVAWLERARRHAGSDGESTEDYDFRYNAQKFCRKVFAQDAVFDEDRYVFWFDADCVVKQPIPEEFLKGLLDDCALAYLGRRNSYTETGFIGFDTQHQNFKTFRDAYLPWIMSGKIFSQLVGWHDCIAFDHARQGVAGRNLTPQGIGIDNVIGQSVVGKYVSHLKGPRKFKDKYKRDALHV